MFLQITFIDIDFAGDSHVRSLIGEFPSDKTHRIDSTGYGEICERRVLATTGQGAPIDGAQDYLGILLE